MDATEGDVMTIAHMPGVRQRRVNEDLRVRHPPLRLANTIWRSSYGVGEGQQEPGGAAYAYSHRSCFRNVRIYLFMGFPSAHSQRHLWYLVSSRIAF